MQQSITHPMKRLLIGAFAGGLLLTTTHAQWSHKKGDPEPHPPGHLVQPFTKAEWEASNFAPPESLEWFRDAKYGMFIHFGLSTHDNAELSWGTCHTRKAPDSGNGPVPDEVWQAYPKDFKFEKFNAKEWVEIAKTAGFKYIVVIAKHHDGFHLWDTAHSDFKVTNTPFGRDYLKELADASKEAGMPFGIYYSQRDWYHPDYMPTQPSGERHKKYIEYQNRVVRELLTKYGKVDILWWDAAWWGGMFTADAWDGEKLTRMAREIQPGILLNNRASLPGDFDTPEQRLGYFQNWRPWESCICLTGTWSYSGGEPKSRDQLIQMLVANAACDGNLLLSWGPQWDGEFAPKEKNRLVEVGAWLKENGRAIYGTRGGPWKWSSWGGSTRRDKTVWLHVVEGGTIELPTLPGRTVLSAQLLNGGKIDFQQDAKKLTVTVPKASPVSIVELTFDQSVNDIPAISDGEFLSVFNDAATYGKIVSKEAIVRTSSTSQYDPSGAPQALVAERPADEFAFHTAAEANPWVEMDLGREVSVTGVRVLNRTKFGQPGMDRAATLRLSISSDGKTWTEVWKAESGLPKWEIPVNDFLAGAQVPGRKARYLRLETKPETPDHFHLKQVQVYGKE